MYPSILFLGASILLFSFNINAFPLRNWDEAWYAEIVRNMAGGDHNLLVPFWNGQYYFDKPPLYFWLSFPFFKIFGPGEWQVRIISVLAAASATLLVFLIGKKLFNQKVGILSSLVFVIIGQVWVRFSHGNLDALLVALFLATFYTHLFAKQKKFAVLSGIFLGLGFLVKGWFLGLFPLAAILLFSWITKKRLPYNLSLIILFATLSSGWWYLLGALRFGRPFVNWYLLIVADGKLGHFSLQPFWYLVRDTGIWLIPTALYLIEVVRNKNLIAFALIIFLFIFSLGFLPEKFDWYNLPVYPFVAILTGYSLWELFKKHRKAVSLLVALITIAQVVVVYKIESIYPDRSSTGANLGLVARDIVQPDDALVLDDRDFTSFLYYSNHKKIFVVSKEGGKPGEWWVVKYEDLPAFTNHPILLISKDLNNFPPEFSEQPVLKEYMSYRFVRLAIQ
ncbi:MAG: glycosyltransferase family 39 protein [Candidatus Blackburnbacteria bacterium]|nr:glycosyltransferase family 39 protein [Candidatus Blackburnbacteria bacterium]